MLEFLGKNNKLFLLAAGLLLLGCAACEGLLPVPTASQTATASQELTLTSSVTPEPTLTLSPTVLSSPILPPTQTDTPSPTEKPTQVPATLTVTSNYTPNRAATFTPFPTATYTPQTGRRPTSTQSPTLRWPFRKWTATNYPTFTSTASLTPTITNTPEPPLSSFRISRPGSMSKLISPFRLEAVVEPGDDGLVTLDLLGEDSRQIVHQLLKVQSGWIAPNIDFKISAVSELARLVLSSEDTFNRKIAVTSIDVILLSFGEAEIAASEGDLKPYVVWSPKSRESISGGTVTVTGVARPVNETPVIFELIDEQGNVIAQQKIDIARPTLESGQTHTPFTVDLTYSVTQSTGVRLTIRQESNGRIPGTVQLFSLLLKLEP